MPPSTSSSSSSRWCPTPEQVMILEEMYKSGVRTPIASQIQKITDHLSFYGKIEGKNVFYWFQNHKARDRQKLRRKLITKQRLSQDQQLFITNQNMHASSCFALHQPSHDNSSPNCLHQVGADSSFHAQMINLTWKLDTPEIQKLGAKSNGDDWMIMMLREACGTSTCCSKNMTRPLKTLDLFPINSPSTVKVEEEQQHCTTTKNGPSSVMSLDIML